MIDQVPNTEGIVHVAVRTLTATDGSDASAIHASDLDLLAALTMRRGNTPAAERRRVEAVRSLLAAASDVNRALSTFLKHALVHCQGTPGCSDLAADSRAVAVALDNLSARFGRTSGEYRAEYEGQALVGDHERPTKVTRAADRISAPRRQSRGREGGSSARG